MIIQLLVQQSSTQRNQRIAVRALYATVAVVCVSEVYGVLDQQDPRILTVEYSLLYATSFVLAFTFVWLTAKRNVQISINQSGLEISHDEDVVRFTWYDVKQTKKPVMWRRYWLFELKNAKKIKISTRYFSRKQIQQFNHIITRDITFSGNSTTKTQIEHPRLFKSGRR